MRWMWMTCLLVACGSTPGGADDAGPPASDAGVATDAGGGGSDAGEGDVCEGMSEAPPDGTPSGRTVRFHVTGPETAYVITNGMFCSGFGVDELRLVAPFNCACECPAPSAGGSGQQIGAGLDLEWGGDQLLGYRTCVDCAERGWPGLGAAFETSTVRDAVEPGTHVLTLLVADEAPPGCVVGEGTIDCMESGGAGPTDGSLCVVNGTREVKVDFDLPATGDVDVDVTIPAP